MRILLSNDDGYLAAGLAALRNALADVADVTIVAPDRNRSGASNSLTLDAPLRVTDHGNDVYSVNGTPSDCVHVAITGLLELEPDMVIAGVNHGANLGDDVIYSGTVAAAMEGRFLGLPAIAVSLVLEDTASYRTAAAFARSLVERIVVEPLPKDTILNVNVPDLPLSRVGPPRTTRLGFRHKSEPVIRAEDPRRQPIYWIGPAGSGQDTGPGTDFHAIAEGCVSVTPIRVDLTDHQALDPLESWLNGL